MEYSLLVLLNFFALPSARLDFKRGKINIRKKQRIPFHARIGNEPFKLTRTKKKVINTGAPGL